MGCPGMVLGVLEFVRMGYTVTSCLVHDTFILGLGQLSSRMGDVFFAGFEMAGQGCGIVQLGVQHDTTC